MDMSYWFALIHRRDQLTDIITIKPNMGRLIVIFLTLGLEEPTLTLLKVQVLQNAKRWSVRERDK